MTELHSYFKPLNQGIYSIKDRWETTQIGRLIDSHTQDHFPNLEDVQIAIFNIQEYEGTKNSSSKTDCKVRDAFYRLHFDSFPKVVDFGILKLMPTRKESFQIIEDVCSFLIKKDITPFIIGGGQDISYAIYKSYVSLQKTITLSCVDKSFDIGLEDDKLASFSFLSKILSFTPNHLFHYVNLGYQSFYTSPIAVEMLENMNFDIYRLGNLKARIHEIEPVMRNTDFLSFDLSAIQYSYAPANVYSSPNGLTGEDACKIMRYAGISDKLTAVGIFEYNENIDPDNQTAQLIAQMMWYFIEGYKQRKNELNPDLSSCIKYTVAFEDGRNEIVFYKSNTSGRWWMGVPFKSKDKKTFDNYFVACSYQDYELANQGEVPERWVRTFRKFS